MMQGIIDFIQSYPKLFVFIIAEIIYAAVLFSELLRIKEKPNKRKMIGLICEGIVFILSVIMLVIFIFNRDFII